MRRLGEKKSRATTTYKWLLIGSAVLFTAFFVYNILIITRPQWFGERITIYYILSLFFLIIFSFGIIFSIIALVDETRLIKQLKIENKYIFGVENTFYDLSAFKRRVESVLSKSKSNKKNQYIIAFSVSSIKISSNSFHNRNIMTLNYEMAKFLSELFEGKGDFSHNNNIFGFDHGNFLIYTLTNNEKYIQDLVDRIMNETYRIVKDKQIKIWAQPFFGVKRIEDDASLSVHIEDAISAKNASENNFDSYTFYNAETKVNETNEELEEIRNAIDNHEFIPFYQLKYSVKEKRFVSSEALARWKHPTRGILSPIAFIEKAEKVGLLSTIDLCIFEEVLKDLSEAHKKGRKVLPVSVNFSLYEFFSHNFLETIVGMLQEYQVPPTLIEIEVTETTSQVNKFLSVSVIKKLKDLGIRVLMDDFGSAYSGVDNLRKIPFDAIKIDKSFTDEILTDDKTRALVSLLINIGHLNDIEVIIEGVENKEQYDVLRRMKIDTIQGFYFAKPLEYRYMEDYVRAFEKEKGKKK